MNKTSHWLRAARLRTLPLALSCVVISAFLALYYGSFNITILTFSALTTILLQILANFSNDYGDAFHGADNATRIGPDRMVQAGNISPDQMRKAIVLTLLLTVISGIALLCSSFGSRLFTTGPMVLLLLGLISIMAAIKYTAGRNPYGYKGFGDVSVLLFFGLLGVLGNLYLYTHQLEVIDVLPAVSVGALSIAVLNLNNMRDRNEDEKVGKITIPVRLGFTGAKIYHIILLLVAAVCAFVFSLNTDRSFYQFIYVIPFIALLIHALKVVKTTNAIDFDSELKKVALSTFLFAILFGLGLTI